MSSDRGGPSRVIGAVLGGRYRLLRLIGAGGLATVYEAEGLQGQGLRAIKLLQPEFQSRRNVVERFYAEARACHALRHPNIAETLEFDYAEDGSPYIVMELLVGLSLEDYLRSNPPIAPEQAARLVLDALAALSLAHSSGVIHRDIKPPNLFLVAGANGSKVLKVLDFGIAKVMDVAGGLGRKTRTGAVLGTPGYMSAEQLKDAKSCDARSDLWSLGVVFYEMLTHHHPYGDDDQMARAVAILRDPARPIVDLAPELAGWDAFFQQALAREPAHRFQSAEAMAQRIRELVAQAAATAYSVKPAQPRGGATLSSQNALAFAAPAGGPHMVHRGGYTPHVDVVSAASFEPPSVVWWAVLVIALACFASGLLLGYVIAS